jgi:hypothetical protein
VVSNLSGATHGVALLARVLGAVMAGLGVYAAVAIMLGRRQEAHRHR